MKKTFNPLSFLQALWAWWLSVSFFMYVMFMTKHKWPIPTFDTLLPYFQTWNIREIVMITLSVLWITFFLVLHIVTLIKNFKQFFIFKKSKEFKEFKETNSEITLITIPLTLAMTLNVLFIAFAIFVPNFWSIIEYAFPIAILMFVLIGILALVIYGRYFVKRMLLWWLSPDNNNSLTQLISAFAFSMVWVWLAWSTAMSRVVETSAIAMFFSIFFLVIAFIIVFIKIVIGFGAMFSNWINKQSSPSLWMKIPILTLFWISLVRHNLALEHVFGVHLEWMKMFVLTSIIFSMQIFFWYIWYIVMKKNNYFKDYLYWKEKDVTTFALICPWVAFVVFGMFFVHKWLIFSWILEKFSIIYFILLLPLLFVQIKTVIIMLKLNRKLKS